MKRRTAAISLIVGIVLTVVGGLIAPHFDWAYVIIVCGALTVAISIVVLYRLLTVRKDGKVMPQYRRKSQYITTAEYNFMHLLRGINPNKYEVVPQVALNSVIDKVTMNSFRNELFRVVDFLFVDKDTFEPLLLVELNDASHKRADRVERDRKVNEICNNAKMPIVTFWTTDSNDFATIRKTVLKNILKR